MNQKSTESPKAPEVPAFAKVSEVAEVADAPEVTANTRHFTVLLSSTPRGARLARLLATEQLRSWELPLDPARQIVAELAANAASHGRVPGRDFRLTLSAATATDTLRIEVTDTRGERFPHPQTPAPLADSGRGLLLVEDLAHRWGVTEDPCPRKTVWAELRLSPSEPNSMTTSASA